MHIQTHLMSGWCIGNYLNLTSRERLFCMCAATMADLDGLGIVAGQRVYQEYHHVLGHNLPFALLFSTVLAIFSSSRAKAFLIYFALAHLHLIIDYFGSGPLWKIYYLWPISRWSIMRAEAWEFYSWQNLSVALAFLIWTILIVYRKGRTPLEAIMPSLDKQLVALFRRST